MLKARCFCYKEGLGLRQEISQTHSLARSGLRRRAKEQKIAVKLTFSGRGCVWKAIWHASREVAALMVPNLDARGICSTTYLSVSLVGLNQAIRYSVLLSYWMTDLRRSAPGNPIS